MIQSKISMCMVHLTRSNTFVSLSAKSEYRRRGHLERVNQEKDAISFLSASIIPSPFCLFSISDQIEYTPDAHSNAENAYGIRACVISVHSQYLWLSGRRGDFFSWKKREKNSHFNLIILKRVLRTESELATRHCFQSRSAKQGEQRADYRLFFSLSLLSTPTLGPLYLYYFQTYDGIER